MLENKENNFVSAVVYMRNDENRIIDFFTRLNETLRTHFRQYEIIFVDDKSTDRGVERLKNASGAIDDAVVSVVHMSYCQGVELAMNAGVDLAIGDFVFEFDDMGMDGRLDFVMQAYRRSLDGYDIVSAAPRQNARLSSKIFYAVFNRYSGSPYKLQTETFRVLSRRAINRVHSMSKTIPYRKAVYASCGLKMDRIAYRDAGGREASRASAGRTDAAVDALILFTDVAYKVAVALAALMMAFTVLTAGYTVYIFFENQPVAGWTTIMLFLALAFFGVFGIFAIMIKYASLLLDLIFKKQKYITESVEKITRY